MGLCIWNRVSVYIWDYVSVYIWDCVSVCIWIVYLYEIGIYIISVVISNIHILC